MEDLIDTNDAPPDHRLRPTARTSEWRSNEWRSNEWHRIASALRMVFALAVGLILASVGALVPADGAYAAKQSRKTASKAPAKVSAKAAIKPAERASGAATSRAAERRRTAAPRVASSRKVERDAARAKRVRVSIDHRARAPAMRKVMRRQAIVAPTPPRMSIGQAIGLHDVYDPLSLHSSVALVMDAASGEVLYEKNAQAVLPIASISKLMTAMVVLDGNQALDEPLTITEADIDTERFSSSRLRPGTVLSRDAMLQLALMASENRAANALGRHYPGGLDRFVARMNAKARELGMRDTNFVEPTGLSSRNVSTAVDLSILVRAAATYPLVRAYSTAQSLTVDDSTREISFRNTNRLIDLPDWQIGLQKTGYISEAGNCLVMGTSIGGRSVVLVLLDAIGKLARFGDAERIRSWLVEMPRPDGVQRAFVQPSRGS